MPQHRRITLKEVEQALEVMDSHHTDHRDPIADLLRTLVVVDQTLVKHDKTPLARQLRQSFFRFVDSL